MDIHLERGNANKIMNRILERDLIQLKASNYRWRDLRMQFPGVF